jgi:hypothetical protein
MNKWAGEYDAPSTSMNDTPSEGFVYGLSFVGTVTIAPIFVKLSTNGASVISIGYICNLS